MLRVLHYLDGNGVWCGASGYFGQRYVYRTSDITAVTCKKCLRQIAIRDKMESRYKSSRVPAREDK